MQMMKKSEAAVLVLFLSHLLSLTVNPPMIIAFKKSLNARRWFPQGNMCLGMRGLGR